MSMDDAEDTYAPQSPDLSGYHSPHQTDLLPQAHDLYQQQLSHQGSYSQSTQYSQIHTFDDHLTSQPRNPGSSKTKMPKHARTKADDSDAQSAKGPRARSTSRKGKKPKVEVACEKPAPGVEEGIEVTTKFPVARIKRIMQADEDVGKVAQTTPTAVSKALELFMISAITRAAKEARVKSSKRVTNAHLKLSVEKEEQFDFLQEVLAKIPDAPLVKKDDDSEETGDAKKKKGASKRKKKDADDF